MDDIAIRLTYAQADALVLAACAMADLAEGNWENILEAWTQKDGPDMASANQLALDTARDALEGADRIRPELDSANARDPELQEFLHRCKMRAKHGNEWDQLDG